MSTSQEMLETEARTRRHIEAEKIVRALAMFDDLESIGPLRAMARAWVRAGKGFSLSAAQATDYLDRDV